MMGNSRTGSQSSPAEPADVPPAPAAGDASASGTVGHDDLFWHILDTKDVYLMAVPVGTRVRCRYRHTNGWWEQVAGFEEEARWMPGNDQGWPRRDDWSERQSARARDDDGQTVTWTTITVVVVAVVDVVVVVVVVSVVVFTVTTTIFRNQNSD